jgi:lipopolysaccharide transport system permease protein
MFPEAWRWILYVNPMSALVIAYQSVLLLGQWPGLSVWLVTLAWIAALAILLNALIERSRDELVDWL